MFEITSEKDKYIVSFKGLNRLNYFVVEELSKELSLFFTNPAGKLLINFKGIDFIDSSGFNLLGLISKKAVELGFKFEICHMSDEIKELIERVDLPGIIMIESLVEAKPCT